MRAPSSHLHIGSSLSLLWWAVTCRYHVIALVALNALTRVEGTFLLDIDADRTHMQLRPRHIPFEWRLNTNSRTGYSPSSTFISSISPYKMRAGTMNASSTTPAACAIETRQWRT